MEMNTNEGLINHARYSDMVFFNEFGEEYTSHSPYMLEQEFDNTFVFQSISFT